VLTARQYREVVVPDDSTGKCPVTLARKWSRCKEGMARVFAIMAGVVWGIRVSRYKVTKWPSHSPGIGCGKRAMARSRYKHYGFVLGAGTIAKTVTNNFPLLSVLAFRANINTVSGNQVIRSHGKRIKMSLYNHD
jgi:hypothetical protein